MKRGRPGETYIIAGPPHTLIEAFDLAARITGIPAPRFHASPGFLRAIAALSRSERLRDVAGGSYLRDNAKARPQLRVEPKAPGDGLRRTLQDQKRMLRIPSPSSRLCL